MYAARSVTEIAPRASSRLKVCEHFITISYAGSTQSRCHQPLRFALEVAEETEQHLGRCSSKLYFDCSTSFW